MSVRLVLTLAAVIGLGVGHAGASTCTTVAATGVITPDAFAFARRFTGSPAINASGDVLFVTRPRGTKPRIYLYPAGGSPSVVVAADDLAPNNSLFRSFDSPSLDDAGDLAFYARMTVGEGVFLRPSGSPLEVAGITTGTSPGGGVFGTFPSRSAVNAGKQVAFVATVSGGPNGVFLYDGVAHTASTVALAGQSAGGGRTFCDFSTVALGASSVVAFQATTRVDCADNSETALEGIFADVLGTLHTLALQGIASPVPGTTYASFTGAPEVNGAGHVSVRAGVTGVLGGTAVVRFDPVAMSSVKVVLTGEATPGSGGFIGRMDAQRLADSDAVFVKAGVQEALARSGVFRYDAMPDTVLLSSDAPPTDVFGIGARFSSLGPIGIASDGSHFAIVVKVRDVVLPRDKSAVLGCVP